MKQLAILLLIFFLSPAAFAQKKYIPDHDIEFYKTNGIVYVQQVSTGKRLTSNSKFDFVTEVYHGLIGFKQNDHFGLINIYGKVVIPAIYDKVEEEDYTAFQFLGNYIGLSKGGKLTVLDTLGKTVVPLGDWQLVDEIEYGLVVVYQNDKVGLFKNGKQVLPCLYDAVPEYGTLSFDLEKKHDVERIQKNDSVGLIDKNGTLIVPTVYDKIYRLESDFWIASKNDTCTIYDIHGKLLLKTDLMGVEHIHGDFILGYKGRNFGIINWKGEVIYPFELDLFGTKIVNNSIFAKNKGNWGLIQLNQPMKTEFCYQNIYEPTWNEVGICVLLKNGYFGFLNQKGEVVVPFDLKTNDTYFNVYQKYVIVERNDKQGIIESNGRFKIPCQYDSLIVSDYLPIKAINNSKMGLLNENGEVLIPLQYDEIGGGLMNQTVIVKNNHQSGVYFMGKKELIPTLYDSIYAYNNYYCVVLNGKQGLFDAEGKQIIPCQFTNVVAMRDVNVVVQTNNILSQYNIETGQLETLKPDSICRFETTSFVNFGGKYTEYPGDEISQIIFEGGVWMFMENDSKRIIGDVFHQASQFNAQKYIAATPLGKDDFYAYNHLGQNIKPNFHVINKELFSKIIFDTSEDTILVHLQKEGLLKNVAEAQWQQYIKEHYDVSVSSSFYYDEYGNEYDAFLLTVSDKKGFFSLFAPFPEEPNYVYNYYDFYSYTSEANAAGWRWAVPKQSSSYSYNDHDMNYQLLNSCILVNDLGEVRSPINQVAIESTPFLEINMLDYTIDNEKSGLLLLADTLRDYLPVPASMSNEDFARIYADSIYYFTYEAPYFSEYGEEMYQYGYLFYHRKGLQLSNVAPPDQLKYEFFPKSFADMKGAEGLKTPDYWTRFEIGKQRAYAFGTQQRFLFPTYLLEKSEAEQEIYVQELLASLPADVNPEVKNQIHNYKKYRPLVQKGIARTNYFEAEISAWHLEKINMEDYTIFEYSTNVGLAFENEVVVQPNYNFALADLDESGTIRAILLTDTTGKVVRFDVATRKVEKVKNMRFLVATSEEVVMVDQTQQLMNCYPKGKKYVDDHFEATTFKQISAKGIRGFYRNDNCFDVPYMSSTGEDSIQLLPDGTMVYVYPPCDTVLFDQYSKYDPRKSFTFYELANGEVYLFDGIKIEGLRISDEVRYRDLPLNNDWYRPFSISKQATGYQLSSGENSLTIPFKTYKALLKQTPTSNFYGGVVIDGVYYSYQTLKPFPEQHDIIIRTSQDNYTIGNKKQLENVVLGYDNTIVSREKL